MTHGATSEKSPAQGRALVVVAVVVVLVVTGVIAVVGPEGGVGSAARVIFSVTIAGSAFGLINMFMAGKATRSNQELAQSLAHLEQSATGVDPTVVAAVQQARATLAAGDVQAAQAAVEQLPVGPSAGPVAEAVKDVRRAAKKAARLDRRQQRVAR